MIELTHVSKTFSTKSGNVDAVKDVSLTIESGSIFGLIGYSGAGKSTLIRMINLLERPDSGSVIIDGVDLTTLSGAMLRKRRQKIGMIFQHFNLMSALTVADNVAFPLKRSGLAKNEIKTKVDRLLELVELSNRKDSYPAQLSGGQKQRVAIARALANDPDILLCDEATSALDPQTTESILALLKRLHDTLGLTIVLITHQMSVIKTIAQSVAIMENGNVVEQGNVYDIFANPKEAITRKFVDSTTQMASVSSLIDSGYTLLKCDHNEKLIQLTYVQDSAAQALISMVSRQYNVDCNIVFGSVEVICGQPLGQLIIKIKGDPTNVKASIDTIKQHQVKVEVISA